jgi:hypothetical protein
MGPVVTASPVKQLATSKAASEPKAEIPAPRLGPQQETLERQEDSRRGLRNVNDSDESEVCAHCGQPLAECSFFQLFEPHTAKRMFLNDPRYKYHQHSV